MFVFYFSSFRLNAGSAQSTKITVIKKISQWAYPYYLLDYCSKHLLVAIKLCFLRTTMHNIKMFQAKEFFTDVVQQLVKHKISF